jgi:acetyl esterase/lipase
LLVSPVPTAYLIRRVFEKTGAVTAAALEEGAPEDVEVRRDVRYGDGAADRYDLYLPGREKPVGLVFWIHGGAFVGGAKEELSGYLKRIAHAGFAVVAPEYPLAPKARHPTQLAQLTACLDRVMSSTDFDADSLFLAGDSAGAMLATQMALTVVDADYASLVGVTPTIGAEWLAGMVLCCGPFGLAEFERTSEVGRRFGDAVLWAYSGQRRFSDDQGFVGAMSVTQWVGPSFPPTLITVGNADPLAPQSEALAQSLETAGVTVERRFFTADHRPALGHEYQFDLGTQEARDFLDRMTSWLHARSARDSRPRA